MSTLTRAAAALIIGAAMTMTHIAQGASDKAMSDPNSTKPSIVLVHGAFADGSSWAKVIPLLENDGYSVTAVQFLSLDGSGCHPGSSSAHRTRRSIHTSCAQAKRANGTITEGAWSHVPFLSQPCVVMKVIRGRLKARDRARQSMMAARSDTR